MFPAFTVASEAFERSEIDVQISAAFSYSSLACRRPVSDHVACKTSALSIKSCASFFACDAPAVDASPTPAKSSNIKDIAATLKEVLQSLVPHPVMLSDS